jgi:hypothetical protein
MIRYSFISNLIHRWPLFRNGLLVQASFFYPFAFCQFCHTSFHHKSRAISVLANLSLNQYSNRWSDFDLCMRPYFYRLFRATNNHAPCPQIRSISFHCIWPSNAPNFQLTCPRLDANLSSFQIDGTNIQRDNLISDFPAVLHSGFTCGRVHSDIHWIRVVLARERNPLKHRFRRCL